MTRKAGSRSMRTDGTTSLEPVDGPIATLRKEIARAGHTGWHKHGCGEVLYATAGVMVINTEEFTWMVPPGFAVIMAPEVMHDSACLGPLSLCAAFIETNFFRDATGGMPSRLIRVSALLDSALRALAEEGDEDADDEDTDDTAKRTDLLISLVAMELARAENVEFGLPIPKDRGLRQVCMRLMEEPHLEGDIDHWAELAGLSRRTMTRRFREQTSLSFAEWRRRLRTASAAMRSAGGVPLPRVAGLVGYKTVHGLRAMMKRVSKGAAAS